MSAVAVHAAPRSTAPAARSWATLAVVALAQFMVILDATVVNVALPSIGRSLSFAPADLQWVVTAYVLFTGGLMLLGGRATDLLGRRRVFLAGLLVFTGASLTSGLAWSPAALVAARAAQGVGAALLVPAALAIVTTAYEGAQRRTALAVWGALGGAGAAAGVLLGGVITTLLGWEWVFFVNVPVGLAVALGTTRLVPAATERRAPMRLDLAGALVVMTGLVTLVYALDGAPQHGWGSARTLALLGVAVALLAAFAAIERAGRDPLLPPATWRMRPLVASAAVMLGATGVLVGTFFLNTVYLQRVLGDSALETGLAFLPLTAVILLAAHVASHVLEHAGSRVVALVGLALMAGGSLLLAAAPDRASYLQDLLPGFLVLGFGVGMTFVAAQVTAMSEIRHEQAGLASGLMTTAHELGAALGVAVLSAVALTGSGGGGFAAGYGDGFLVAAGAAAVLALGALVALPSVRPAPGTRVAMH
jgi:EmrB/QacA subfamily drug resistance transporter